MISYSVTFQIAAEPEGTERGAASRRRTQAGRATALAGLPSRYDRPAHHDPLWAASLSAGPPAQPARQ